MSLLSQPGKSAGAPSRLTLAFWQHESALWKLFRRFALNRQDAEDICQETLVRALEAERSREIREPGAFLFGIARNVIHRELDRRSSSLIDFVNDLSTVDRAMDSPSLEEELDARQRMLHFAEAVSTLPPQCQRVFLLKKMHGYSHKQIAHLLNISVSTVEKHVASGLKRCADFLSGQRSFDNGERAPGAVPSELREWLKP